MLDAFCPHMGAHLGFGGEVVGNSIKCPFHGWSFDREGKCQRIPYTSRLTEEVREGVACGIGVQGPYTHIITYIYITYHE